MAKYVKGQSGNPGGRPKEDAQLKELARAQTPEAIKTLVSIMKGKRSPAAARVSAACALLDRGYGKPAQQVELDATVRQCDVSAEPLSPDEWDETYRGGGS